MTTEVIYQKIESLRNCIERIESKKPFTADDLRKNFDLQDIISINLERAVQVSVDLASHLLAESGGKPPSTMAETFILLANENKISLNVAESLVKAVGLRNLLVHEYSKIDWDIVAKVANEHLDTFRKFAKEVLN
ncbi:MAG: type VII toxin-antitoxin system HepT family RNase toxin [Bdellovibrionia bacterium]